MTRKLIIGAAQLGPIARDETRRQVVARMLDLMQSAATHNCGLVVFPELALTTFFPRWYTEDQREIDQYFETEMPGPDTQILFDTAKELGMGFHLGYAELVVDKEKIHLPGHSEYEPTYPFQHLEKRYFDVGDLGFVTFNAFNAIAGMCICNDRRWPESFRVLGLQGAELVMLGYNTPVHYPRMPGHDHLQDFHNHLSMQAGVIGVAKAGREEGCDLIGGSCIIAPTGEIVAQCTTLDDELVVAECDFARCDEIKSNVFDFARHRQPQHYGLIAAPANSAGNER